MIQSIAKRKGQLSTRCVMGFSRGLILLSTALVVVFTTLFFRTFVDLAQAKAKRTFSQGEKPQAGWLYVVDSRNGSKEAQILLIAPAEGRIVKTFKTGMNPDIAVSPDGSKLYIAFTDLDQSGGRRELLAVVDTTSGALLRTVNNPNRVFYNIVPPSSSMALSHNGRWLYVMKYKPIATFNTLYWIEAFDTKLGNFLPEKATLSSCGWARPLPARMDDKFKWPARNQKMYDSLSSTQAGLLLRPRSSFPRRRVPRAPAREMKLALTS